MVQATEAAEAKRPAARPRGGDRKLGVGDEGRPDVDAVGGDAEPGSRELGDGLGIGDPARAEATRAPQHREVGGLQVVAVLPADHRDAEQAAGELAVERSPRQRRPQQVGAIVAKTADEAHRRADEARGVVPEHLPGDAGLRQPRRRLAVLGQQGEDLHLVTELLHQPEHLNHRKRRASAVEAVDEVDDLHCGGMRPAEEPSVKCKKQRMAYF